MMQELTTKTGSASSELLLYRFSEEKNGELLA